MAKTPQKSHGLSRYWHWPSRLVVAGLLLLIKGYRYLLSPWIGNQCRFYPSCSHYAEDALKEYGALKGSALTLWRLLRCNPWSKGGFDPAVKDPAVKNQTYKHGSNNCPHSTQHS